MLRLRPKAISASNVKATLLPTKVIRPLKLLVFVSEKHWELFCMQLKTSCTLQVKTFQVPGSADFWQIYLKKLKTGGLSQNLLKSMEKLP